MDHAPLIARWRRCAAALQRYGPEAAAVLEDVADELEAFDCQHAGETLTLLQASVASGYSRDHISRMISEKRIKNVGRKGKPLVRRSDLPRKPNKPVEARRANGDGAAGGPDLATEMLRRRGLVEL